MSQPLLSIGVLLGDNCRPEGVRRCLASLEPLRASVSCRVLAGDLGAPAPVRAAAERADAILDLPWTGDLSAARNALLDRCRGRWFLSLSPNEYLDGDLSQLEDFLYGEEGAQGAFLREAGGGEPSLPRLLRRASGARFVGALHETVRWDPTGERCARLDRTVLHCQGPWRGEGLQDGMLPPAELLELERAVEAGTGGLAAAHRFAEVCGDDRLCLRRIHAALGQFQWEADRVHAAGLLCRAIRLTTRPEEAEELLSKGLERLPDSLLLAMDGPAALLEHCYRLGRYQSAANWGGQFLAARRRLREGADNPDEPAACAPWSGVPAWEARLLVQLGDSLCRLERWAEADALLLCLDAEDVSGLPEDLWKRLAGTLLRRGERLDHGGELAKCLWRSAQPGGSRRGWLLEAMNSRFLNGAERPGLTALLAAVADGPGPSARALLAKTPEAAALALAAVRDWDGVLRAAYPHVMRLGAELPEGFFRQKSEALADIAASLPQYDPGFPRTAAAYGLAFVPETPARLTWLLDVTAAALRAGDVEDTETMEALCRQFHWTAADYLGNVYNPDLLNEGDLSALPGLHAFGWCFVRAQEANGRGDGLEAVRLLRLGLRLAPGMKRAVEFQVRRIQAALDAGASSPDLLAMAGQIREKVAALRDAADPGLDALLRSPLYQRLQALIDMPDPC